MRGAAGRTDAERPPRLRADLTAARRWSFGRPVWLIADPLRRRYLRLSESDFRSLLAGEGHRDLRNAAIEQGLIAGVAATPARQPWPNPLYLRFPGIDFSGVAERLVPWSGWLLSGRAVVVWMLVILAAAVELLVHWERLLAELPRFDQFFGPERWPLLLGVLAVTKVLHELGHALVCRRMGATPGEVGLLLLCFTPCLYCDVTDAWALPRRSQRAAVMAAGIYVELVLAAVATLIWIRTHAGDLHYLAMDVIFVCGASTLLFNANPLMRYDGYYLLADGLDVGNLRARAAGKWQLLVRGVLAGAPQAVLRRGTLLFAGYHVTSAAYRAVAIVLVGVWIIAMADAAHMKALGVAAAGGLWGGWALSVARGGGRWIAGRGPWRPIGSGRRWAVSAGLVLIAITILLWSWPRRIAVTGLVDLRQASPVHLATGGRVARIAAPVGSVVRRGETIAVLENERLELEHETLAGRARQLAGQIRSLRRQALAEPLLLEQLEGLQVAFAAVDEQRQMIEQQLAGLTLRSPADGVVMPASSEARPGAEPRGAAVQRAGQYWPAGAVWCRVGKPRELDLVWRVAPDQRRLVIPGAATRGVAVSHPMCVAVSAVREISEPREPGSAHVEPASGQSPAAAGERTAGGAAAVLEVRCPLEDAALMPGTSVRGWIAGPAEPLWKQAFRSLRQAWR